MKTLKLVSSFLALALIYLIGAAIGIHNGVDPVASGLTFSVIGVITGIVQPAGTMATAISTTGIVAALGAFFRANKDIIISDLYIGMDIADRFTIQEGVADELPLPKITMGNIVQPGNDSTFNPTANGINVGARILKTRNWKVDLTINPRALVKTWLGFTKQPGTRQSKIPLEQFMLEEIKKQIQHELRMSSLYRGVFNGAGTGAIDVCNGLLRLVADEITAGNLTPIVTGAITSTNVVDRILQVYDAMDEAWKNAEDGQITVSSTIFDWYVRRLNPLFTANLVATNEGGAIQRRRINEVQLEGTNYMLKREPGMGTSQRIICTLKKNQHIGIDTMNDYNNFDFQVFNRDIKVLVDGTIGVQLAQADNRAIRVNDQV
jgi:hypothetical protein